MNESYFLISYVIKNTVVSKLNMFIEYVNRYRFNLPYKNYFNNYFSSSPKPYPFTQYVNMFTIHSSGGFYLQIILNN